PHPALALRNRDAGNARLRAAPRRSRRFAQRRCARGPRDLGLRQRLRAPPRVAGGIPARARGVGLRNRADRRRGDLRGPAELARSLLGGGLGGHLGRPSGIGEAPCASSEAIAVEATSRSRATTGPPATTPRSRTRTASTQTWRTSGSIEGHVRGRSGAGSAEPELWHPTSRRVGAGRRSKMEIKRNIYA